MLGPYSCADEDSDLLLGPYSCADEDSGLLLGPYSCADEDSGLLLGSYSCADEDSGLMLGLDSCADEDSGLLLCHRVVGRAISDVWNERNEFVFFLVPSSPRRRINVFGNGITLLGRSDVSRAVTTPCRLQLCTVLRCVHTMPLCASWQGQMALPELV